MPLTQPGMNYQQTVYWFIWQQVGQLPFKARWQDVPLASRSLAKAFKDNIFLHSLLLLFDGL